MCHSLLIGKSLRSTNSNTVQNPKSVLRALHSPPYGLKHTCLCLLRALHLVPVASPGISAEAYPSPAQLHELALQSHPCYTPPRCFCGTKTHSPLAHHSSNLQTCRTSTTRMTSFPEFDMVWCLGPQLQWPLRTCATEVGNRFLSGQAGARVFWRLFSQVFFLNRKFKNGFIFSYSYTFHWWSLTLKTPVPPYSLFL